MLEKTSNIKSICQKHQEDAASHKAKLLMCKEDIVATANAVIEHSTTTVELLQQQQNDVSNSCKNMDAVFRESTLPLVHGIQDIVSPVSMN